MPEFSNYAESRTPATDIAGIIIPLSKDGDSRSITEDLLTPFRGQWAGTTAFPETGGRHTGGVPRAGDHWFLTAELEVGGNNYGPGTVIMALVNTPGQTLTNWAKLSGQL